MRGFRCFFILGRDKIALYLACIWAVFAKYRLNVNVNMNVNVNVAQILFRDAASSLRPCRLPSNILPLRGSAIQQFPNNDKGE